MEVDYHSGMASEVSPHGGAVAGRVLVIDDDPAVRRALQRLLRAAGRQVEAFASAREFLARLPDDGPACVVLDLQLPDMSGIELQALMAERGVSLPIVFLTGHGDVPTSVQAMKHGAVDFLQKPVDDGVLLRTVDDALARSAVENARRRERQDVAGRLARLSAREREVMERVIRGRLNKQIAGELDIAVKTVKVHRGRAMAKMEVRSVAELVRACELAGLLPAESSAFTPPPAASSADAPAQPPFAPTAGGC